MKVLGIIPARAGSKRLSGKNLRLLGGKPLVAWTIEAARDASRLDRLVVSSDDREVLELAGRYDSALPLPRPAELAADDSPAIDYVRHALQVLEGQGAGPFAAIAIMQPSSPFTEPGDIDATIELLERSGADTAVTVQQLDHAIHPAKLKLMDGNRLLPYFEEERGRMASAELPQVFVRNCSVYATRRHVVDAGQIIGPDCRGHIMPSERSLDINGEMDFLFAEFLWARRQRS